MDIQSLLPLFLNIDGKNNDTLTKLLSSFASGEKDRSKLFKEIDPAMLFAQASQKQNHRSKPCGLAPIAEIAGNVVLGMLTRYLAV